MKFEKKINYKKRMLTRVNFLNSWPESLDRKHHTKNHKMQSLTNQRFKDEIEKNIYKRIKKIAIRRIKIKIKYKLKGNKKTFDWRVKLKRKKTLTKGQKNQKNKD